MGIPVVIASNGRGICVRNVTSGAPVMTVATNGFGIPIVLGTTGIPFVVQGAGPATLATLSLSGTLRNNLSSSGTILGATPTSTIVSNVSGLTVNSGARTYTWDGTGAAGSTSNGLVETLVGATGSPKSTSITVLAAVTLATLSLSGTITNGTSSSGTITGASTGSTIVSNVTGLTVNSGARTYSWDGTGAAGSTSNGLVETLSGAIGSPKNSSITVAAAAGTIGTPVIAQTSSAGAAPFAWSVLEDATFFPGDYWEVARTTGASTGAASTALTTATPNGSDATLASLNGHAIQQITVGDLADTSTIVFSDLTSAPAGPLALRIRVGQEDGMGGYVWGNWSNILTDTIIASSTAVLAGTTGVNKSQYIDTTGTPKLIATMNAHLGALCAVRATQTASGKRHWEMTIGAFSAGDTPLNMGISDSATAIGPSVFTKPGSTAPGFSVDIYSAYGNINVFANGGTVPDYNLIGGAPAQVGDVFAMEFDTATNVVDLWQVRGGTVLLLGSRTLTSGIPTNWSAQMGATSNNSTAASMTANFGATTFAKSLTSGYSMYG